MSGRQPAQNSPESSSDCSPASNHHPHFFAAEHELIEVGQLGVGPPVLFIANRVTGALKLFSEVSDAGH
jgi:hypothetical protein